MDVAELAMTVDSRDLDRAKRASRGLADEAQKAGRTVATSASVMARNWKIAAAATAGAVVALRSLGTAVRVLREFESSMSQVGAISRASTSDLAAMRDMAKDLGSTTEFTAAQAADGLKFLAMAGFDAQQSLSAIPDVLDLATASAMGLAQAADITSNIMSAFGVAAEDAADVTDALFAVSSRANTSVEQVGEAMKFVGPVAKAMGISVNDAAAAMGVLSDNGLQGSMAGTGLRKVLSSLVNPTNEAADALAAMGINLEDVNPATQDLTDIIDTLATAGISAADALTIFGDRGGPAILALVGNNTRLRTLTAEMQNVEGAATDAATTMRDNLGGDIDSLVSSIQGLIISLGDAGLTAILRTIIQVATNVARGFTAIIDAIARIPAGVNAILGMGSAQQELATASEQAAQAMNEELAKSDLLNGSFTAGRTVALETAQVTLARAKASLQAADALRQENVENIKATEGYRNQLAVQASLRQEIADYTRLRDEAIARGMEEGRVDAERYGNLITDLRTATVLMEKMVAEAGEVTPEIEAAQAVIEQMERDIAAAADGMVVYGGAVGDATDDTNALAEAWNQVAINSSKAVANMGVSVAGGRGGGAQDPRAGYRTEFENQLKDDDEPAGGGGGGGGGSSVDQAAQAREQAAARITALVQSQWTEQQKLNFELERYRTLMNEGTINTDQFGQAQAVLQQQMAEAQWGETQQKIESIGQGLLAAAQNGENLGEALIQMLAQMAAQWLIAAAAAKAADVLSGGILSASMGASGPGGGGVLGLIGLGANANGTNDWRGGPTVVGERGREIVNLPKGSQVIPNDRTNNALKGMQPNVNVAAPEVEVVVLDDPSKVDTYRTTPRGERERARANRRMQS